MTARTIANLGDGVKTSDIADSNVTTAKIADSNVTTAKIADDNVTTAKIADSNVTTAKIADDAVTFAKMSVPYFRGYLDAVVSVPNATETDISSWTVSEDPLGNWDAGNGIWEVPTTGIYLVIFSITIPDTTTGDTRLGIRAVDPGNYDVTRRYMYSENRDSGIASAGNNRTIMAIQDYTLGEYIGVNVFHGIGSTQDYGIAPSSTVRNITNVFQICQLA